MKPLLLDPQVLGTAAGAVHLIAALVLAGVRLRRPRRLEPEPGLLQVIEALPAGSWVEQVSPDGTITRISLSNGS